MKSRKTAKKEPLQKPKQSLRHILGNTGYMLKLLWKLAPDHLLYYFFFSLLDPVIYFFTTTWLLRYIVNGFQQGRGFAEMAVMAVILSAVMVLWELIDEAYQRFREKMISLKVEEACDTMLFHKEAEVELACFEDKEYYDRFVKASGEFSARIFGVARSARRLLYRMISFSLYTWFVFTIDWVLLLFALIPVAASFFFGKRRNKLQHEYDMKRREEERQRDYTRRSFYLADYAKEMRMSGIHRVMFGRFHRSMQNIIAYIKAYGWKLAMLGYIRDELQEVVSVMGAQLYAVYCTLVPGTMGYGDCLVVLDTVETLSYDIGGFMDDVLAFQGHSLYVDTIREYLEYEPKLQGGALAVPKTGDLCLSNVSFRYAGQSDDVLKNLSFTVRAGEKIALVGQNGAGKTTLAKLLMRLYDPTEGTIRYADRDIRDYRLDGDEGYRARFGTVFQDFRLFALSAKENVLLRRENEGDDALVRRAMEDAGIAEKVDGFPDGMDTVLTREFDPKGQVLSGGEGQKLAIARIFAKNCSVVLLDEPSSALDPVAEYQMYENMMRASRGKTVVFISHRLSSAVLADRVLFLEKGRLVEEGSHEELMAKNGRYAKLFRVQAESYLSDDTGKEAAHG